MSIDLGTETIAIAKQERTWRVELFCEKGSDPQIVAHREVITSDADGNVIARDRNIPAVRRLLSAIGDQTVAGVSGMQLAGVIAAWADVLRQEDISAEDPS